MMGALVFAPQKQHWALGMDFRPCSQSTIRALKKPHRKSREFPGPIGLPPSVVKFKACCHSAPPSRGDAHLPGRQQSCK